MGPTPLAKRSGDDIASELSTSSDLFVLRDTMVDGPITCDDASISRAIRFENCTLDTFACSRTTFSHAISFLGCTVNSVIVEDAILEGPFVFEGGRCSRLAANRARINGRLFIEKTVLETLECGGIQAHGEITVAAHIDGGCTFEGAHGTGKLDLNDLYVHRDLSLRHSDFDVVFLDRATVRGTLEAGRILIKKSFYARNIEVGAELSLKGAKIGGQALLHEAQIGGEVNISGLRARSVHMNRGRISGGLRGRGIAIEDGLLLKTSVVGNELVLKGGTLGELSLYGSELNEVVMFDLTIRGSAIFGLPDTIETAGHIAPHISRERLPSKDTMIALLERRKALRARGLHLDGIRCESLLLHAVHIDRCIVRNALVNSLFDLTRFSCTDIAIEMSKISGNLRGRETIASSIRFMSSAVESATIFEGIKVDRYESRDSHYESLVFTDAVVDGRAPIRSSVASIELDEIRAGIINVYHVEGLDRLQINESSAMRLDIKTLQHLPRQLSVTTSQITVIDLDPAPRYTPRRARQCGPRYTGCEINFSGTIFTTVSCDVESLLTIWLPTKNASTSRPSLAILENALRSSGYDDWADDVYQEFRRQVRRDPNEDRMHKIRNFIADSLIGFGFSTRKTLALLLLPFMLGLLITLAVPGMTTMRVAQQGPINSRGGVAIASAPIAHPPLSSATDLVLRSYLPAGGDAETLEYRRCKPNEYLCPDITSSVLRALGLVLFPLFLATLVGLLRYTDRRTA